MHGPLLQLVPSLPGLRHERVGGEVLFSLEDERDGLLKLPLCYKDLEVEGKKLYYK